MASASSSANSSHCCPYPICGKPLDATRAQTVCVCEYRHTLKTCPQCKTANRVEALYCRACRGKLDRNSERAVDGHPGPAGFVGVRGSFRRPPLALNGTLYALDTDGRLIGISPRAGATPVKIAQLRYPGGCFNRGAVVDASDPHGDVRGWIYLAISPFGVEAVSLTTARVTQLYEAAAPTQILANSNETDATSFRGLVAGASFCAFATRASETAVALTVRHYSSQRAIEHPLKLTGTRVIGPAMHGGLIALCSEEQAGIYDAVRGEAVVTHLPESFRPLMSRAGQGLFVPPGGMPLTVFHGENGRELWVAGYEAEKARVGESLVPGCLRLYLDQGRSEFQIFSDYDYACFAANSDGSLCISTVTSIELPGRPRISAPGSRLAGMPTSLQEETLTAFAEDPSPGWHKVMLSSQGGNAEAYFEDPDQQCNTESCCGIFLFGWDVVVPYLDVTADAEQDGLKFAHWNFAQ